MSADFIAGAYTATYNAKALGQAAEGWRFLEQVFKRLITGDAGGDTPQDAVYRGREMFLSARLIEADKAGILDLLFPYSGTVGTAGELGVVGLLDVRGAGTGSPTSRCKSLVLTAVDGTSAKADMQDTYTAPLAILAEGFPVEILLAPDLKEVPVRLRVYPTMSTGVFYTET